MEAFLVCMWVVMLMGTLGGELRYLLRHRGATFAVLVVIGFFVACFLTRSWLIDRAVFRPTIKRGKTSLRVQLFPAIAAVRDHVLKRAEELGIVGTLHVYYIPGTWSSVDAYVFGAGRHQIVVVSGGLQALHGAVDEVSNERFRFVIDHELGHIAGRDTDLLYFARATALVGAGLLVLKAIFIAVVGFDTALRGYAEVFPPSTRGAFMSGATPMATAPADWFVITFFILFTALCMCLSVYFYVMIARRREHLADRFAIRHSPDASRAIGAMEALLAGPALSTAPPHAFLGSVRWHPSAVERRNTIALRTLAAIPEMIGVVMVVLAIMSMRFMLGDMNSEMLTGRRDPYGLVMASAIYVLMIGTVIDLMLSDGETRSYRAQIKHTWGEIARLVWWTAVVSVGLALAAYFFVVPAEFDRQKMEGVEYLADTEAIERALLILSAPLTVAGFGIANLACMGMKARMSGFPGRAAITLASCMVAVLLLFSLGTMTSHLVAANRKTAFEQYWKARALAYQSGKTALDRRLEKLAQTYPELSIPQQSFWPRPDIREELAMFPEEAEQYALRLSQPFAPPFSFIALWHAPVRSSML